MGVRVIERMRLYTKIFKGHNSVNCVYGVVVHVLFILSDSVLYLCQVLSKYFIGFQSYGLEQ